MTVDLPWLRGRDQVELTATMECAGNGRALFSPRAVSQPWLLEAVGTARWTGAALGDLLDEVGVDDDAVEVVFTGADRGYEGGAVHSYQRALTVAEARGSGAVVAHEMNGAPIPPQHGHPVRLVVPDWYGMTNVKWLTGITAVTEPHRGYQDAVAFRIRDDPGDPGTPVTRMAPRSLMIPPGIPDFSSRHRLLGPGRCLLEGRAWSGHAPVEAVEVSVDGGTTWLPADLAPEAGRHAWRRFSCPWEAAPGDHLLTSRCRDRAGNTQPDRAAWNLGGYANNGLQWIAVTVVAQA
jgi:DMSO/TMAO reductase YedYZ molybdopterin-dependent catalytic subunit